MYLGLLDTTFLLCVLLLTEDIYQQSADLMSALVQ